MPNKIYKIIETADSSPSLEWLSTGEAMHNRQGALSESLELYGATIKEALMRFQHPRILSVGLGLAYNEIIACSLALQCGVKNIYIESFEENENLRNQWQKWLSDEETELGPVYQKILESCVLHFQLKNNQELKSKIQNDYQKSHCVLRERLDFSTNFENSFNCILYDPFSAKTNPECWSEEFLTHLFTKVCETECFITTYAAKGTLKRSLKSLGFQVETPEGFGGKRQCTKASRLKIFGSK